MQQASERFWTRNGPDSALSRHVLTYRSRPNNTARPNDDVKRARPPSPELVGECPGG